MCKTIDSEIVISYALVEMNEISVSTLHKIRRIVMRRVEDINVQITRASINEALASNPRFFSTTNRENTFVISRQLTKRKIFNYSYLDSCYSSFFQKKELESLKTVIKELVDENV